jgi:hypothetical protein
VFIAWTLKEARIEILLNPQSDPPIKFQAHATTIKKNTKNKKFLLFAAIPQQITPPTF